MRIEVRLIGYWVVSRGNKGVRSGGLTPRSGLAFACDSSWGDQRESRGRSEDEYREVRGRVVGE